MESQNAGERLHKKKTAQRTPANLAIAGFTDEGGILPCFFERYPRPRERLINQGKAGKGSRTKNSSPK
jgi:hypothetical protein